MRFAASRLGATISLSTTLGALLVSGPALASGEPQRQATQIRVTPESAGGSSVRVEFTRTPTYTARLEPSGRRLIVDVPDAVLGKVPPALTETVGVVGGVLTQTFESKGENITRVLVTLREKAKYAVAVEGNALVMRFVPGGSGVLDLPAGKAQKSPPSAVAEPRVMDVGFNHGEREDRITLSLSEGAQFRETQVSPTHARLTLLAAKLPEELERTLDVSAFDGRISTISSYRQKDGSVVIDVERRAGAEGIVRRQGSALVWSFYDPGKLPTTLTGVARDGKAARRSRTVSVEKPIAGASPIESGHEGAVETRIEPDQASGFASSLMGQQRRVFTGRRIDLDLKDADIHNVLRLLADVGQVNIVTSDNVGGTVTIRMRNVPWDQALDVVLQSKSLGMVRQANMIRVAPLAELDKERELQIARRQQEINLAPLETRLIPVSYATAAMLQARAQPLLSPRGSIAVDERTNVLIVRDLAGNLNQIEELTRSLDTQTPQVLVEARIVEANSNYARDVGIQ
ncbi:MAG TPA: AMIN domain-containing protein, partial [Polyangiaceae bacterium]